MDKEKAMQQWDEARNYIANGGRGSWPRDMFESYLDYITKIEMELEREKQNDIIKSKLLNHLEAENERLRGALGKIANYSPFHSDIQGSRGLVEIARQALDDNQSKQG